MNKNYYFNGGMYVDGITRVFKAVRPAVNGLPYITNSEKGILVADHHSSVYMLSDDFRTATLIGDNGIQNPKQVDLPYSLEIDFKAAVAKYEREQE